MQVTESVTDQGEIALHGAAAEGAPDVIDLPLDAAASVNAVSVHLDTSLEIWLPRDGEIRSCVFWGVEQVWR